MSFCAECGTDAGAARFCRRCGAPQPVAEAAPKRRLAVPLLGAAGVLVVAAAVAFVLLRGGDGGPGAAIAGAPTAAGGRTPPGLTETGVTFPIGTQVRGLVSSRGTAWAVTVGGDWSGLTRLGDGGPNFWPLPEAEQEKFLGNLHPRPDGRVWLVSDSTNVALVDPSGSIARLKLSGAGISWLNTVGPDGRLWSWMMDDHRLVIVDERGAIEQRDVTIPPAEDDEEYCNYTQMTVEPGGAAWLTDAGCGRLLRIVDGTAEAYSILPDGVTLPDDRPVMPMSVLWTGDQRLLTTNGTRNGVSVAAVDIDHTVTAIDFQSSLEAWARGLFTDGGDSAWLTISGGCQIAHIDGTRAPRVLTPFPAAFVAPAGGDELWIAGETRIERIPAKGASGNCDVEGPGVTIPALEDVTELSISRLEREGLMVEVGEASRLSLDFTFGYESEPGDFGTIKETRVLREPGVEKVEIPPAIITRARNRLADGKHPMLSTSTNATDASGNSGYPPEGTATTTVKLVE